MPPFVGVAVNVTELLAQIVADGLAAMLTLTGRFGFTVIVIVLEVAGLPVPQLAVEVITQVIVLPFVSAALVYVGELVPTFAPFSFHW